MSRVRVVLNYIDVAILCRNIKVADTFEEVVKQTNRLEKILDDATKQKGAEFLNERGDVTMGSSS
jgi:hypothetical protein